VIAFGVSFVATAGPQSASTTDSTSTAPSNSPATDVAQPAADVPAAQPTLTPAPVAAAPSATVGGSDGGEVAPRRKDEALAWLGDLVRPLDLCADGSAERAALVRPDLGAEPHAAARVALQRHVLWPRARMFISQEFTVSDTTSSRNEIELSDIYATVGYAGYTEKITGIKATADVLFTIPTSKLSQYKTQALNLGPGVGLSRKFNILGGLTLGYGVRPTIHFNQYTTAQRKGSTILTGNKQPVRLRRLAALRRRLREPQRVGARVEPRSQPRQRLQRDHQRGQPQRVLRHRSRPET